MVANFYTFFRRHSAYRVLFLRFAIGLFILYSVQDNVFGWPRMLELRDILQERGVPFPLLAVNLSVYVQCIGGVLLLSGGAERLVELLLII